MSTELTTLSPGVMEQADMLVKSRLLPKEVDSAPKAVAIMMKGKEVGIPPMQAFAHIHIINGKPTMSAELMLALIRKHNPKAKIHIVERTNERCVIVASRPGESPAEFVFTMDDAKRAELLRNSSWTKYPRAMLHARCVAEMARSMFPDAIAGISYTPEEMGADVDENGEIIEAEIVHKEPTPKPAKGSLIYNGEAGEIHDAIILQLKNRKIPEIVWDPILKAMIGKGGKELRAITDKLVAEYKKEVGEPADEVPFAQ